LALTVFVVLPAAKRAHAEEEWNRHAIDDGVVSIALPATWHIERDDLGTWVTGRSRAARPEEVVFVRLASHPLVEGEALDAFHGRREESVRSGQIRDVGYDVEDMASEWVAGREARWTLAALPRAEPPRRVLFVSLLVGGRGITVECSVLHERFVDERETLLRIIDGVQTQLDRPSTGHVEFPHRIPEWIHARVLPFLREVERASAKRWFGPDEQDAYQRALRAWEETQTHMRRLQGDPAYRAAVQAYATLHHDRTLASAHLAVQFDPPYVVVYVDREPLTIYDLPATAGAEEERAMAARAAAAEAVLREKARILSQVYDEFLRRYAEPFDLRPLTDAFGGRPDYPMGVRSFNDGVPLVVLVAADQETFAAMIDAGGRVPPSGRTPSLVATGLFTPRTGRIQLPRSSPDPAARRFEIDQTAALAVSQLVHWFTRQRNHWAMPRFSQGFFSTGFPEWFGAVVMDPDRNLRFTGLNVQRLDDMQRMASALERQDRTYPIFPLERLLSFGDYGSVAQWGVSESGMPAPAVLSMFFQQSWALVYFLHEHEDGAYRDGLERFLDAVLSRETGLNQTRAVFERAFGMEKPEDFQALEFAFQRFVREDLLKRDLGPYRYDPPALENWGE
jgi:hypothetical protein